MKKYEELMLEWDAQLLEQRVLNEEMGGFTGGAAIGAGVGAGSAIYGWLKKRAMVKQKAVQCNGDPQCLAGVNAELSALNAEALKSGVKRSLIGGAAGAAVGTAAQMGRGAMNMATATYADDQNAIGSLPNTAQALNPIRQGELTGKMIGGEKGATAGITSGVPSFLYNLGSSQTNDELNKYLTNQTMQGKLH